MQQLNFPAYNFRFKNSKNKVSIFDEIRKKFILLTPEEWVRQHVVRYLLEDKKYPLSLINVEKELKINDLKKRYDVVVFKNDGTINVLVECKAPAVQITQITFDQIARYNLQLKADFLMVTNGFSHYYCSTDDNSYQFLEEIPIYNNF